MSLEQQTVVVTGIGMVTPLGNNTHDTWSALISGKNGIGSITHFDASTLPSRIAAEAKGFNIDDVSLDKKLLKYTTHSIRFALAASEEALQDAGVRPTAETSGQWGITLGSGMIVTEFDYWQDFHENFAESGELDIAKLGKVGMQQASATEFGSMQSNTGLGLLAKQHNISGYTMGVHTACASGGHALGLGLQAIRSGEADYILAGGYDSMIEPLSVAGFCLLGALSTNNDSPETACRPFDLMRNGFILGEGAAFLVLETLANAKKRGAKIYAEIAGEGNSLSAYRITDSHPSGDGAIQAIAAALKDAKINKESIDYINAHGTSTKMNDLCETNALKTAFGEHAKQLEISSTKSQTGHLISAAGALEGAFSVLALHHSQLPKTANLNTPDPECDLDYIADGVREKKINAVLSNSFGFGGSNSCIVFKHPDFIGKH